ncbi:hypothetical protein [Roseomonas sp. CECT 9278]|uniref:hypothetical protein n=1 Tax=Roseomonas sp. CECT 9278 TaxID=2845823 RepID=UPI001E5B4A78|nr:hypothetical protein [Roseomonas sp. CECT 9278]CAH0270180.1 hypothetical protein ROS9278_03642 [Roseomonas sp. CECT 9278]
MPHLTRIALAGLAALLAACATPPPPAPPPPPIPVACLAPAGAPQRDIDMVDIEMRWAPAEGYFLVGGCLVVPGVPAVLTANAAWALLNRRGAVVGAGGSGRYEGPYLPPEGGGPIAFRLGANPSAPDPTAVTARVLVRSEITLCDDAACTARRQITRSMVRTARFVGPRPP